MEFVEDLTCRQHGYRQWQLSQMGRLTRYEAGNWTYDPGQLSQMGRLTRYEAGNWTYDPGCYIREYKGSLIIKLANFINKIDEGQKMIKCIIVAENDCNGEVYKFETQKEASAFCEGVTTGANLYGAGGCIAYTRDDLENLDSEDEIEALHIDFIEKFLPEENPNV